MYCRISVEEAKEPGKPGGPAGPGGPGGPDVTEIEPGEEKNLTVKILWSTSGL